MIPQSRSIQTRITLGHWTLPAAILIAVICPVAILILWPPAADAMQGTLLWQAMCGLFPSGWSNTLINLLFCGLIGYLLIVLNNSFALIRTRASMQTAIYFLIASACPFLYTLHAGHIAAAALAGSFYFLFHSYQLQQPEGDLFHSFVCLGIGSLFFPQLLYVIPLFWIGAYLFQSLHARSFCASLVGVSLPYWFLLGHALWHKELALFSAWSVLWSPSPSVAISPGEIATLTYLFLLYAVSAIHCMVSVFEDKLRTRAYLQFLILLDFFLFAGALLLPTPCSEWIPLLLIGVSILSGHLFVLTHSRLSNLFFIGSMAGLVLLLLFNVWQL